MWEDLLGQLRRARLIADLLVDGGIAAAVPQAEHGHKPDRALTAEKTAMRVIAGSRTVMSRRACMYRKPESAI